MRQACQAGGSPPRPIGDTDPFRWLVIVPRHMVDLGQPGADVLETPYLCLLRCMGTAYDQIEAIRTKLGATADLIWGQCSGYPSDRNPEAFHAWVDSHTLPIRYFVAGYPPRSVTRIRSSSASEIASGPLTQRSYIPPLVSCWRRSTMTLVEVDEVQGNVLYAYSDQFRHARYVLFHVTHPTTARAKLAAGLGGSRSAAARNVDRTPTRTTSPVPPTSAQCDSSPAPQHCLHILGAGGAQDPRRLPVRVSRRVPRGRAATATDNGDVAASSPGKWLPGLGTGHVLLVVYACSEGERDRLVDDLTRELHGCMKVLHDLSGSRLESTRRSEIHEDSAWTRRPQACDSRLDREHFGFADGCSQPAVQGVSIDPTGSGVDARTPPRWWRPLRPLELMLEDLGIKPIIRQWRQSAPASSFWVRKRGRGIPPGPT